MPLSPLAPMLRRDALALRTGPGREDGPPNDTSPKILGDPRVRELADPAACVSDYIDQASCWWTRGGKVA